jgi:DHA2 family multidrug resistance protein
MAQPPPGAKAGEDAAPPLAAPPVRLTTAPLIIVTICSMLATVMQALDSTIANVALPYMQGTMAASQDEINWVLTSYIVAAAIMTAPTGFLSARLGRTRLFVGSVIGFTISSILCGAAQTLDQIVVFRVLQGICGAALVPLSQSVMFDIYPPERRGAAMAMWGVGVQLGPIFGPILGGWLTEHYNWRWVFYVNVPFGIITALGLLVFLKDTPRNTTIRLDWLGFGALSLAIGAFQLMLDRGEELDWFAANEIVIYAFLAGIGFYIFLIQSALAPKPFLSPRLFTDLNFCLGTFFIFVVGLILYATLALMAPYLQLLMNYPVVSAGLVLAPRGIGTMIAAVVCGRLVGTVSARILVGIGFVASAYALYAMTFWTPDVGQWSIISTGVIQGLGVGFVFVPLTVAAFATLPGELRTQAAGIYSLMRNLGSAVGISVTSALLLTNTQANHAVIAARITPFDRGLQTGAAAHFWDPDTLKGIATLNDEITRQANIIAYVDDFKLMLILALIALPLVLLIRPTGIKHTGERPEAPAE